MHLSSTLPTRADVGAAYARVREYVRCTPITAADADLLGFEADVTLKLETLQCSGSFKARGAFNALLSQPTGDAGVIAASGGNHGAALAFAARRLGLRAEVYVPVTAPAAKVERLRAYGAVVVQQGTRYQQAFEAAMARQAESGARFVHAYDQPDVVAGQGTAGLEFEAQTAPGGTLDTLIVAVGGGGLIGGQLAWFAGGPTKVIAVETRGTASLLAALERGEPVDVPVAGIAVDSLGASRIGAIGFALARASLHCHVIVEDEDVLDAQRRLWDRCRLVTEPGGATALAALTSGRWRPLEGERVGVLVCGGNVSALPGLD